MDPKIYAIMTDRTAPDLKMLSLSVQQKELLLGGLGVGGEGGEVEEVIKKHVFHGHPLDREKLIKEMGDTLWYLSYLANRLGITLSEIMDENIAKLSKRYPEGTFSTARSLHRAEGDV